MTIMIDANQVWEADQAIDIGSSGNKGFTPQVSLNR